MLKKSVLFLFLTICLLLSLPGIGFSETDPSTFAVPYKSYTYDFWQEPVPAPQAYIPLKIISGTDLGVGPFSDPRDLFVDRESKVYISDTGNNRVIILDKSWAVSQVITEFDNNGVMDKFNSPRGIFVSEQGDIYVADRNNSRIIVLNQAGELQQIIGPPQADFKGAFREDFRYNPRKIGVDKVGRIFVIADEVYDGILEFDVAGNFRGFIGAPNVSPSIVDYLWRRFSSAERRKKLSLFLPTEHSSLDIDDRGFIYATVSDGEIRHTQAIRRLNPSGTDVMRRAGFNPPIGDYGLALLDVYGDDTLASSLFVDVLARENGIYSALDQRRGRVFTYDDSGNLLYVFGGTSYSRGTFRLPVALAEQDGYMLILDNGSNMITMFEPTEYQKAIHGAIHYYYEDDYEASVKEWKRVKEMNINLDVAHTGIGRAQLREDKFADAMASFRLGENRQDYSKAFALYRRQVIYENFTKVVVGLVVLSVLLIVIKRIDLIEKIRHKWRSWEVAATRVESSKPSIMSGGWWENLGLGFFTTIRSLIYALYLIFHPIDGFWDLKHEKRGTKAGATILLALLTGTYILVRQYTGFIFNMRDLNKLNIYVELASVLIPFFLWCIVNWSLTTISEGKGTFEDIYITVAYACTPLILINIPLTIFSNYLTANEASFYFVLSLLSTFWTLLLLFIGTMIVHQYSVGKTVAFSFLTVVGMGLTLFIGLLYFNVAEQAYQFVTELYTEIVFRR